MSMALYVHAFTVSVDDACTVHDAPLACLKFYHRNAAITPFRFTLLNIKFITYP